MSKELLSKAGQFLLETSREAFVGLVDEKVFYERVDCIEKTVVAMKESNVSEDQIIAMLQKYWDLRLSEAKKFVYENNEVI